MIQAVLLMASVLGASVYYWQHNKELSYLQTLDTINPNDIILPRYEMHPIILNECFWPILKPNEEDIKSYLKNKKKKRREWCRPSAEVEVEFKEDDSSISFSIEQPSSNISCFVSDLNTPSNSYPQFENPTIILLKKDVKQEVPFTSFVIECYKNENDLVFRKSYLNPRKSVKEDDETVESTFNSPSIAILYMKSMSNAQFQREFVKTNRIMKRYNFFSFSMFNKISNDVSESIKRTFTHGGLEENISDYMKSRYCKILTNDHRLGAQSSINMTNWTEKLKSDTCANEDTATIRTIEEWTKFSVENNEKCHFSNFLTDNISDSKTMDDQLSNSLEMFQLHEVYKNTIIVILSAEGIPLGHFGNSYTGRVEERNPILAIHMPAKLEKIRPDHIFHLEQNQNRLITHLDVFEMLRSFSRISKNQIIVPIDSSEMESRIEAERGISLWQSLVPRNRTCKEALISDEFCLCMENKIKIEAAYNQTNEMTARVFEQMETEILANYSCLADVAEVPDKNSTQVFNLNAKVLAGASSYVEFFKHSVRTFPKSTNKSRIQHIVVLGQFKHYLNDEYRIERSHPYALVTKGLFCMAGFLERFCDMCHERTIASA